MMDRNQAGESKMNTKIKPKGKSKMRAKAEPCARENETVGVAIAEVEVISDNCPSHEEIAALAYSYWEARGFQGGSPKEDWLRAERELRIGRSQPKD
jgi:hypothetical protein